MASSASARSRFALTAPSISGESALTLPSSIVIVATPSAISYVLSSAISAFPVPAWP
jgi:hypothetical protein